MALLDLASAIRERASASAAGLAVLAAVAGCSGPDVSDGAAAGDGVVRVADASAVSILDLDPLAATSMRISREGDADYEFHRIADIMPLDDGGIAVIDASRRLRYFDDGGGLTASVGGPGEGPGEFSNPIGIQRVGGMLAVLDLRPARISLFDQDGSLVGILQAPPLQQPERREGILAMVSASLVGTLADSTLVVQGPSFFLSEAGPGWRQVMGPIRLLDFEGAEQAQLGEIPVMTFYEAPGENPPIRNSPHAPMLSIAVLGTRVAVTAGDAFEITVFEGGRVVRYREDRDPVPAPTRGRPDDAIYPPLQPTYRQLVIDPDGHILAREYQLDPEAPQLWSIIARDGTLPTRYRMPAGFRLLRSWNGVLYGVWTDDLGVESVGWLRPRGVPQR